MKTTNNSTYDVGGDKKSPFASYKNERLQIFAGNPSRNVQLNDVDKLVMLAVNEMLLATSKLLHTYLMQLGLKSVDIEGIRTSLKKLSETGYLTKMEFSSPTGKSLSKVYTLGAKGQAFIRESGKHPMLSAYIYELDAVGVKRILSAVQFVLSQNYLSGAKSISIATVVAEKWGRDATESAHIFRPNAIVQIENKTVFVESVRRSPGYKDELVKKLERMDECLKYSRYLNVSVNDNAEVIIVCEDFDHMVEVGAAIKASGFRFSFDLTFTNDNDVYAKPDSCLYENRDCEQKKTLFEKALVFLGVNVK